MGKLIEVIAISNFEAMLVIRSKVENYKNLETAIRYAMIRVKELDTTDEKFELETVRVIDSLKEPKL